MAITVCELCGKPFNSALGRLCTPCSKSVDASYLKVRKYIYQNPKDCEYITIIEATEVPEKELNYLIKKGRIEIANTAGSGLRCRACGKETTSGSICEQCMTKIVAEKLTSRDHTASDSKDSDEAAGRKPIIPTSFMNRLKTQ